MIIIHQCFSIYLFSFFIRSAINMNFGTGSAGTGIAHFPEIIFLIAK